MDAERYHKFSAYLDKHDFEVGHNIHGKYYEIHKRGQLGFWSFAYWQINQHCENVLALLTMTTGYLFPGTPNSYRCPDCGCDTDQQVARGAIEGSTRCQKCYDYNTGGA
jgi:hypothetical protein